MAKITDETLTKLAENLALMSAQEREKFLRKLEGQYSSDVVERLQKKLDVQFQAVSSQLELQNHLFRGSGGSSAEKLIEQVQDEVRLELLEKMPSAPTHEPKKSQALNNTGQYLNKSSSTQNQSAHNVSSQSTAANSVAIAHQKASAALDQARKNVGQYHQHKTADNRQIALSSLKKARDLRNQYLQTQQKAASSTDHTVATKRVLNSSYSDRLQQLAQGTRAKASQATAEAKKIANDYRINRHPEKRNRVVKAIKHARHLLRRANVLQKHAQLLRKSEVTMGKFKIVMNNMRHTTPKNQNNVPYKKGLSK